MHPDLAPAWPINSYGVMLVIAFYSAYFLSRWTAKQDGIDPHRMVDVLLLAAVLGIVGSRTAHVIQHLDEMNSLIDYVAIWRGGFMFYGGLIAAIVGLMIYVAWRRIPMWVLADAAAPAVMLWLAFGRIGCFLNGCCWGEVCEPDFPLAVRFPRQIESIPADQVAPDLVELLESAPAGKWLVVHAPGLPADVNTREKLIEYVKQNPHTRHETIVTYGRVRAGHGKRYVDRITGSHALLRHLVQFPEKTGPDAERSLHVHPTQLYSSFGAFTICGIVMLWRHIRRRPGEAFAVMLMCYAVVRFIVEGLRDDTNPVLWNLTLSQVTGIPVFVAGLIGLIICRTRPKSDPKARSRASDRKSKASTTES